MARPLRIEYPNALYHVTSRGNARADIFLDDSDRNNFLNIFEKIVNRYNWLCHAYCLMGNHYHLLVETPDGNLSQGMRQLNGIYTQSSNRRHGQVGHLLQGRFKSVIVEKESHLLELCRYVVLNPVRAGVVDLPQKWRWSSYDATARSGKNAPFLATEWILAQFDTTKTEARKRYRQFVIDGLQLDDAPWKKLKGQVILGSETFVEGLKELFFAKEQIAEIPRLQRHAGRPPLQNMLQPGIRPDKKARNNAILTAHVRYGYTLKEIAAQLDIHYTTVSKVIRLMNGESDFSRPDPDDVTPMMDRGESHKTFATDCTDNGG